MPSEIKVITIFTPATIPYKSGAGLNAFNLAKGYVEQGYKVNIVSFGYGKSKIRENKDGVHIIRIPVFYNHIVLKVLSYFSLLPHYTKYLLISDLAIIYGPMQGYFFLFGIGKLLRIKVLFRSTMLDKDDVTSLIYKFGNSFSNIRRKTIGLMHGYISQSPAMTKQLLLEYGDLIPYFESAQGVDSEKFYPVDQQTKNQLRKELGLPENIKIIISIGYVIERKGYRQIIKELSQLKEIDFLYLVIGNYKPSKEHYMHRAKEEMLSIYNYGSDALKDKINFIGETAIVNKYMRCSDLFILYSSQEGMPNVLLEAMATALPVVIRKIEGVDGFITKNNENALVIDKDEQIAESVGKLLNDEAMGAKLASNARKLIVEKYTMKAVSETIIKTLT